MTNQDNNSEQTLIENFAKSRRPGKVFKKLYGDNSDAVYKLFTERRLDELNEVEKKVDEEFYKSMEEVDPGAFLKKNHAPLVEFCAGSPAEAEVLYAYFSKLNQFPFTDGYSRRTMRTKRYVDCYNRVRPILAEAYRLQIFGVSLGKYLLNDMPEELVEFKKNIRPSEAVADLVAARLDAGDLEVKNALKQFFTGDSNVAFIEIYMILGVVKSDDKELHELLANMLIGARLQEGLRQAICERVDLGTAAAFQTVVNAIAKQNLTRFSSVRRAIATWIGAIDDEDPERSINKIFKLMTQVLNDRNSAYELIEGTDAIEILVGLWGLGVTEIDDAIAEGTRFANSGNDIQKMVAGYYGKCIYQGAFFNNRSYAKKLQRRFLDRLIESKDLAPQVVAVFMLHYLASWNYDVSLDGVDRETAVKHMACLRALLERMPKKKYEWKPLLFPWYKGEISRSDVLIRIALLAKFLNDTETLDELADNLTAFEDYQREEAIKICFSDVKTARQRRALIAAVGGKEKYARNKAFEIAQKVAFTPEEYDQICDLLRFKTPELRLNAIGLLKKQDADGLARSFRTLFASKKEEVRIGGFDILKELAKEQKDNPAFAVGIKLASEIANLSEREKAILEELGPVASSKESVDAPDSSEDDRLFGENVTVDFPKITCSPSDYPIFRVSEERLKELFNRLQEVIDEHKDYEYRTVSGETVVLGNLDYLEPVSRSDSVEEQTPLVDVWKKFYEENVRGLEELYAMKASMFSLDIDDFETDYNSSDKKAIATLSQQVCKSCREIFGAAVVDMSFKSYRYSGKKNKPNLHCTSFGIFNEIVRALEHIYYSRDYAHEIAQKVAAYLCVKAPKELNSIVVKEKNPWSFNDASIVSPFRVPLIADSLEPLRDRIVDQTTFEKEYDLMLNLDDRYRRKPILESKETFSPLDTQYSLNALAYCRAYYSGKTSLEQTYKLILEPTGLTERLDELFRERDPRFACFSGLDKDEKLREQTYHIIDRIIDLVVKAECKRGDAPTPYSESIPSIGKGFLLGIPRFVELLVAFGNETIQRGYSRRSGSRAGYLSHLISVSSPLPSETAEDFAKALKKLKISEKRLVEIGMTAPQWLDFIEEYLNFPGLKNGAYYFIAHMDDEYSTDEKKYAEIARFTPLDKEELQQGAFDIKWFEEAYKTLGEKKFKILYDAAKYITTGARHMRARKYADAALGKVSAADLETQIAAKRNQDLLMSYPLVPLKDDADLLRRYTFIQNFRKESRKFGAQRRTSEGIACDMALRNLATRVGFTDVTRLVLKMENALAESFQKYFDWARLGGETDPEVRIAVSETGAPAVEVRKKGVSLKSIPTAFKKDPYYLEIKDAANEFKEQYRRTVRMFELAMEDCDPYGVDELSTLLANPVVKPIIENLVFVNSQTGECGLLGDFKSGTTVRVAHPVDMYKSKTWPKWQRFFFERQQKDGVKQPFRQVFRELYTKLQEELSDKKTRMFAGNQIQPAKTVAMLKGRRWIADPYGGLQKILYKNDIVVTLWALADWFSPSEIEPPTLEYVQFSDRKTWSDLAIADVPDVVYSEAMRDVDLAVSVAHAGSVDPETSHSTIEMRQVIVQYNLELFGLKNVTLKKSHAFIKGTHGEYTVHLGSGVVHMTGVHQINVLPVHSQSRGPVFLPFLDEDPKTAEVVAKILLFAQDEKIKDPFILEQMK